MTDHKVFKYIIPIEDKSEIELPVSSKILSVESQRDNIVLYALVAMTDEIMTRKRIKILVKGTGNLITESMNEYKFLGTVKMYNNTLMFHVFCKE